MSAKTIDDTRTRGSRGSEGAREVFWLQRLAPALTERLLAGSRPRISPADENHAFPTVRPNIRPLERGSLMRQNVSTALRLLVVLLPLVAVTAAADSREWSPRQREVLDAASRGPIGIEDDFEGWASGYHEDWSYWQLGASANRDRATHMSLVREYVGEGHRIAGFELEPVDVVIRGDVALLRYNALERIEEADGEKREVRFSSAALYVEEDGRWLCLATNIFYPPTED